jgi:hypothetical protein
MSTAAKEIGPIPDRESELAGRWYRVRGFGLGPFGEKWWVAPLNKDKITPFGMDEIPVTASGLEFIEVLDVTDGTARYRRYLVNPDVELVRVSFAPQYETIWSKPAGQLHGTIKRMKLERERAVKVVPQVRADIIAFPMHRIIRRIEHGKGIVVT